MGSCNLVCPMCCGETFNSSQSLKYHLLSMTDNLYCPGCSKRIDSVVALIQHLDRCGQTNDSDEDMVQKDIKNVNVQSISVEMDEEALSEQLNSNFIQTNEGLVIVGGSRTITVDDNGEIKLLEKINSEDQEQETRTLELKPSQESRMMKHGSVVNVKIPVTLDKDSAKNVITIFPDEMQQDDSNQMDTENAEDNEELGARILNVKEEMCDVGAVEEEIQTEVFLNTNYSCSTCNMSFPSVADHIKQYHDGQQVVLEMESDQINSMELSALIAGDNETEIDGENVAFARPRHTMNTLKTEECKDSEGRLYTRKVVQIDKFWNKNQQVAQSNKSSTLLEKLFSNVEGVKVSSDKQVSLRTYKCNQCFNEFAKLSEFKSHPCVNSANHCEHCDQTFTTLKALHAHYKLHKLDAAEMSNNKFVCKQCGTQFTTHKSLRLHSRMHGPVRTRHVDAPEGTGESTFTCLECGKVLSESYKTAHMALHSGDSVTCSICNRKFDSAQSLEMHAAVHTETFYVQRSPSPSETIMAINNANLENETDPSRSKGQSTATSVTMSTMDAAENPQKPYQCQHCGRRFARPHEKVKHERIHTGEKPHVCEVCGKTFRVSYCLTLHMRTHTGVRPYACKHCGKRFKASSVYNHHLLTHSDERAYTCPFCPKTFKTRVQLAGHKNSHTKPFRCTECSRPFASLYAARAHIATHKKDNNLKFSCDICGASYGRAFALKDHLKQHSEEITAAPEPAHEEEVQETFLVADEEEVEEEELVIPSPLPVTQSSGPDDSN